MASILQIVFKRLVGLILRRGHSLGQKVLPIRASMIALPFLPHNNCLEILIFQSVDRLSLFSMLVEGLDCLRKYSLSLVVVINVPHSIGIINLPLLHFFYAFMHSWI